MNPCIVKRRNFRVGFGVKSICDADLETLKVISSRMIDGGSKFQSLEVIGINELAYAFPRLVCNLIAKGYSMFENSIFRANEALEKIIDYISSEQTPWRYP